MVELAKYFEREMLEVEFKDALEAAGVLKGMCASYCLITSEESKFLHCSLDVYRAAFDEQQAQ